MRHLRPDTRSLLRLAGSDTVNATWLAKGAASAYFVARLRTWRLVKTTRPTMAKTGPVPQPGILEIKAYVPGESSVPGGVTPIKLSSNETPLGPSPKAIAAYKAVADELHRYPDGAAAELRNAIARKYGLNAEIKKLGGPGLLFFGRQTHRMHHPDQTVVG